jgi:hypothetical protein
MRCAKARALISLMWTGELDAAEARTLEAHLATCPRCTGEADAAKVSVAEIAALRGWEPHLADRSAITLSVMRGIEGEERGIQRLRRTLQIPHVQTLGRAAAVCNVAALMICAFFFLQTYLDARGIETLEARMRREADSAGVSHRLLYNGPWTAADRARGVFALRQGKQIMASGDVANLVGLLRSSGLGTAPELERLRAKYPGLWSLTLEHGVNASTRRILQTEGTAFLHDVEELVRLGGR